MRVGAVRVSAVRVGAVRIGAVRIGGFDRLSHRRRARSLSLSKGPVLVIGRDAHRCGTPSEAV